MMVVEQQIIQKALNEWFDRYGYASSYPDICHYIINHGLIPDDSEIADSSTRVMNSQQFIEFLKHKPCEMYDMSIKDSPVITENSFYGTVDVNATQLFYHIADNMHMLDCFELVYVYRGECLLGFENDQRILSESDICIIAPGTWHTACIQEESSIVILIMIRKSTFHETFFHMLNKSNPLSGFFRTVLFGSNPANYMLFCTNQSEAIRDVIQNIVIYNLKMDEYTNDLLTSYVNILFGLLLSDHSESIQCSQELTSSQIPQILHYIRRNYTHLSLSSLSKKFHYNISYLSILLKKYTGNSYTQLVNRLRMQDAANYLSATSLHIYEIADRTGFQSPDAFSRSFQKYFGITPSEYRSRQQGDG